MLLFFGPQMDDKLIILLSSFQKKWKIKKRENYVLNLKKNINYDKIRACYKTMKFYLIMLQV